MFNSGCIICGNDLEYTDKDISLSCSVCGKKFTTSVKCTNGHFVCDSCHQSEAVDYIENYCKNNFSKDPVKIATELMRNPKIKMHGPEHHFLVPAVLLTSYYNTIGTPEMIGEKINIAKSRAEKVPGGICGSCGNCGAGVGSGIFISTITKATSLSEEPWKLSNLMTAKSLENIANNGGPRCCKRDSYLAIQTAVEFLKNNFNVYLPVSEIICEFSNMNKDCKKEACLFYKKSI